MKIYVISLLRDYTRRELLRNSFLNYYASFTIFNAFDRDYAKNFLFSESKLIKKNKIEMTSSEVACALSHLEVLKNIVLGEADFALILEDDIIGKDEDIDKIKKIFLSLPQDSILIAGGQEGLRSYKNLYGVPFDNNMEVYKIPSLYYRYLSRACSYVVSKEIAEEIIKLQTEKLDRADQWDELLKNSKNVYFTPILKHPLTLENSHIEYERKVFRGHFFLVTMLREGVFYSLYYYFRKIVTSYWASYKSYIKIGA